MKGQNLLATSLDTNLYQLDSANIVLQTFHIKGTAQARPQMGAMSRSALTQQPLAEL
jgi:hypothetical protein